MKRVNQILWGLVIIAAGVLAVLNVAGVINFSLFFDGWWTLFIIIPCLIGLITDKQKGGNFIGLCVGIVLLLSCQGVFEFKQAGKFVLPVIILIVGVKMLVGGLVNNDGAKVWKEIKKEGKTIKSFRSVFSGIDTDLCGEKAEGIKCTAVFGGIKCDLTSAIFEGKCSINVTAVFGGVDLILPDYVNVKVNSNSFFGGVDNEKHKNLQENSVTVYVNATCFCGGVEIK